jgi:hypothetical protein
MKERPALGIAFSLREAVGKYKRKGDQKSRA